MPGKTLYFKIQVQQYRSCLNLEANSYCYFPLFTYINAGHILEVHMLFLSFLLVELVPRVRGFWVLNMHATRFDKKKKLF